MITTWAKLGRYLGWVLVVWWVAKPLHPEFMVFVPTRATHVVMFVQWSVLWVVMKIIRRK